MGGRGRKWLWCFRSWNSKICCSQEWIEKMSWFFACWCKLKGGYGQKWARSWHSKIKCISQMIWWIEQIDWMIFECWHFWFEPVIYTVFLTFKCWESTAIVFVKNDVLFLTLTRKVLKVGVPKCEIFCFLSNAINKKLWEMSYQTLQFQNFAIPPTWLLHHTTSKYCYSYYAFVTLQFKNFTNPLNTIIWICNLN